MPKCCRCGKEGEIGVELIYHNNHEEGEIILCYNCHKKEHPEFSKKKMKTEKEEFRMKMYSYSFFIMIIGCMFLCYWLIGKWGLLLGIPVGIGLNYIFDKLVFKSNRSIFKK